VRFSLRGKLIVLLSLVAALPLVLALLAIAIGGRDLRVESFGQAMRAAAASESLALSLSLAKDIDKLELATHEQRIMNLLAQAGQLSPTELDRLDRTWRQSPHPRTEPQVRAVIEGPASNLLRLAKRDDPRIIEILVADRYGQLQAATNMTDDFYQADEDWWQGAYNSGDPRVYVPPIGVDPGSEIWALTISIPIVREGEFLGVARAVLDLEQWFGPAQRNVGEFVAPAMLIGRDGRVLHPHVDRQADRFVRDWREELARTPQPVWRLAGGQIQAFAPIRLPEEIGPYKVYSPGWTLSLHLDQQSALGPIYRLTFIVLGVGSVIVLTFYITGLLLVDHVVSKRVKKLDRAVGAVGGGELDYRVLPRWPRSLAGRDELDELALGFDRMAQRIQNTHRQLEEANRLKTSFIRVAGHELRTPVSYILGMARLMRDSRDADKLNQALRNVCDKTRRLDEIIQAMFKLMPDRRYGDRLQVEKVDVSQLLEELYLAVHPFVEQRHQRILIEGAESVPALKTDRAKLWDILENLVTNAIKFTPDGGTITISLGRELGDYVTFAVIDQGPGISSEELPHIFTPFYSGEDVLTHSTGEVGYQKRGMGLGLTIVRHFAQMLGGSVSVTSTGPQGSTFTVKLPQESPQPDLEQSS
jgi:signal transduction histidine kinase